MCPHTTIYVSSYYYICVLILLHTCPHTTTYVSAYYYVASHYYMCPHTTIYRRKGHEAFTTALLLLYYCFATRIGDKGLEAFRVGEGAGGQTVRKLLFSATLNALVAEGLMR
jgi:hypothetical protein